MRKVKQSVSAVLSGVACMVANCVLFLVTMGLYAIFCRVRLIIRKGEKRVAGLA